MPNIYFSAVNNKIGVICLKKTVKILSVLLVFAFSMCVVWVFASCPDLTEEKITNISQTLTVFDSDGKISATFNTGQNRKKISIDKIPVYVKNALISSEDVRFYSHCGIDIKRIFGAAVNDIKSGSLDEGASTITQQLIKNSHLTSEKSFVRKAHEALLALQLERRRSKDEIMEMYLNYVYFGRGAYGIETASQSYFAKSAEELTLDEGAMLIGLLKAPNKYAPHINMEKAISRRNSVLDKMCRYGYITEEEKQEYSSKSIVIVPKEETGDYGYYTDYVLEEGANLLSVSVSDFMGSGYSVYTTLNSHLQESLQEIFLNKENFPNSETQGAAVVVDNKSGGIIALVGGREHEGMRLYNRALAKRQPGSTIKPLLVYAPAFEKGSITATTLLEDYRKDFDGYSPSNFKDKYYGRTTVRNALALSLNVPAVELLNNNGIEYSKSVAEKFGVDFDEDDRYLALALGGMKYGISPLKLASAYRTLAFGGKYTSPWCIEKICDGFGNILYEHETEERSAVKQSTAYLLTDILCGVKNNALKTLDYPVACKTGTVGYENCGYSDAWSASYSSKNTVCVWIGYDRTDSEHCLPENVTGSTYPTDIACLIYNAIGEKGEEFTVPETVKEEVIDGYVLEKYGTVQLAGENTALAYKKREVFEINSVPTEKSDYWEKPKTPYDVTVQADELRRAVIKFTCIQDFAEYILFRKRSGEEEKITVLSGECGEVLEYTDREYREGDEYRILPKHSKITANGAVLEGEYTEYYTLH